MTVVYAIMPYHYLIKRCYILTILISLFILANVSANAADGTSNAPISSSTTDAINNNSAFVFIKPHANTPNTQKFVKDALAKAGVNIQSEVSIDGTTIEKKNLIDQHYYAIASKATILSAKDIPVPEKKFQEAFGESWRQVLEENRACNAMEACKRFECTDPELNEAWNQVKIVKFGGGFYCGLVSVGEKPPLYVFNAFFMNMRSKFVGKDCSIQCYVVDWDPSKLSWSCFRNEILGPTNPAEAPEGSIRRTILEQYKKFGLSSEPNNSDNGVHASASPFEGLAEKMNWLDLKPEQDAFGKLLLANGISKSTIGKWTKDPLVKMSKDSDEMKSIFDTLEDLDTYECLQKMIEINNAN